MKVIKPKRIREYQAAHAAAKVSLEAWLAAAKKARWQNLADVRTVYRSADIVAVTSGRNVLVFNISGNRFRLIVAAHFDRQNLYILRFMTHAEYSKDRWKSEL